MDPSFLFLFAIFALFYFVFFRPQQKRMRAHQALMRSLKPGDVVVTNSGIHGAVAEVEDQVVWLEVAPDVELKVSRNAVSERLEESDAKPEPEAESDDSDDAGA